MNSTDSTDTTDAMDANVILNTLNSFGMDASSFVVFLYHLATLL